MAPVTTHANFQKHENVRPEPHLNITTEQLERKRRLKNFIISGMAFKAAGGIDLCREVNEFLYVTLQVSITVTNVTKVDRTTFVVQAGHFSQKLQVMRNRRKLNYVEGMIVQIYPDYTEREKQIQAHIQRAANEARRNGSVVRAGYMKLYIDGRQWAWNEEKNKLLEVMNYTQLSWID